MLGIGVMIKLLLDPSNLETQHAIEATTGKTITGLDFNEERLVIRTDVGKVKVWDAGQSCCEHRYMTTDDDLQAFVGSTFLGMEILEAPPYEDGNGMHEVQFLVIRTSKGVFTVATHNRHNGYYGGFYVQASLVKDNDESE